MKGNFAKELLYLQQIPIDIVIFTEITILIFKQSKT